MGIVELVQTILVGGVATTFAVQILKSKMVPVAFQNYPRLSAFGASIIASSVAAYQQCSDGSCSALVNQPLDYAAAVAGVFIVSVVTYNNVLKDKP